MAHSSLFKGGLGHMLGTANFYLLVPPMSAQLTLCKSVSATYNSTVNPLGLPASSADISTANPLHAGAAYISTANRSPAGAAYISTANPLHASAAYISTANPLPAGAAYISTANPLPAGAAYISTAKPFVCYCCPYQHS